MFPLSAIPTSLNASGLAPRLDVFPAGTDTTPIIPGQPSEILSPGQTPAAGGSFASTLSQFVADVNAKQMSAADTVNQLQSGGNVSLHQAVIGVEEANVSFQLMVEVRNKLLDAYQEIMRMQV